LRCHDIDRALQGLSAQGVLDYSEDIVQGNPAHVLLACAHDPTETKPKGGEQLREHSPCWTQYDAKP
jgi:hypothetical protein